MYLAVFILNVYSVISLKLDLNGTNFSVLKEQFVFHLYVLIVY